jgi:integrase
VHPNSWISSRLNRSRQNRRSSSVATGVDRVGPYGKKRTWHSLRHTYARLWIEAGGNIYALSAQLGHSSVKVTTDRYGHFSREASKLEAEKVRTPV